MFYTADRQTWTIIDEVDTIDEGLELIRQYEIMDKEDDIYEPDFYDLIDEDDTSVIY